MKIDIIVVYVQRYERGHEMDFVPPITGIHLAGITPAQYDVRVIHQQVEPVDLDSDADLIALSFFSGFALEAYRLAQAFKARGKMVVAGGPHVTFWPEEALRYCDAVVTGEAESVWAELLADAERGALRPVYEGVPQPLDGLPSPRYDLLPDRFFIKKVIQATRGCPFTCSFCTVPSLSPGFRVRPIDDILRQITTDDFPHWWQRKVIWFWDDNLTAKRAYIKDLLRAMIPLKRWWLTQASLDIAKDEELLDLMEQSGCIGVFFGIETFGEESLKDAHKRQNKVQHYHEAVAALHRHGIAVMAGFIAGFDGDSPQAIVEMADRLYEIGIDVPFLSVLTPFKGTPLYDKMVEEGRMLDDRDWAFYNGYNVTFQPKQMSPEALLDAHRALWKRAFSFWHSARRILRSALRLRLGALCLVIAMNGFYCAKRLRGNTPVDMRRWAARSVALAGESTSPRSEVVEQGLD
ncbi:MAG: B12-binding domain-containing radical SAM protein [Anaerolineae bacterium]|nr:B12-binding domain-containing radical SAM protein [Anaerolineae bacterium]